MRIKHSFLGVTIFLALLIAAPLVRSETGTQATPIPPSIGYEAHISAGGAAPPAGVLTNPYKGDKGMAAAGVALFSAMNCDGCHGGGGSGFAAPSLADGRWRYGGADEEIFETIFYGRPKGMPAFGGVLGIEGIWILVTYLKSLPVPDSIATQTWEAH